MLLLLLLLHASINRKIIFRNRINDHCSSFSSNNVRSSSLIVTIIPLVVVAIMIQTALEIKTLITIVIVVIPIVILTLMKVAMFLVILIVI